MARETNAQLKEKCDQLQKSLDDAKLTIRQLEINIKIMGENAEKNDSNKVVLECQILKKEIADIDDTMIFSDFIRSAACRAGQMLNVSDIARDVGISNDTAKRWLKILEKSDIVFFLRPYSNNLLKRTIKTPKMYFFDTGLVAYLTRYSSPEILANGAINGAILENYVVSEIIKTYHNNAKECLIWYYRDTNSNEIDLVIESDGMLHPIEIKRTASPGTELIKPFKLLDKASVPRGKGAIICMKETLSAVDSDNYIVPIWMI